jgi:hypothetical protein
VDDLTNQVHDWEPGIAESGLFWTIPISDSQLSVSPGAGAARFRMDNLAIPDSHDFFNSIDPNHVSVPSHVSFDSRWFGGGAKTRIHDATFGFEGDFVDGPVSIEFTAQQDTNGVVYRSDPMGQRTLSAGVGHERNGVFFR